VVVDFEEVQAGTLNGNLPHRGTFYEAAAMGVSKSRA
jgi:hypothetical protein